MNDGDLADVVCEFGAVMAKESWPSVTLGKIITQRKEFIQINDLKAYKRCRVQLHAQGIVLRDTVLGAEIKTKKQQVCHSGEFLVAEIDAKVGGFGIVPGSLEDSIVSSHYFLFTLDEKSLDHRFLDYFIRTRSFRDQITAQGSTNYAAIRAEDVLSYEIPLPPIEEQRRIVARIEELAARIEEARELRRRAVDEAESLSKIFLDRVYMSSTSRFGVHSLAKTCADITDGDHLTPSFTDSGVKFIFVGNVSSGFLHFKGCKYVDPEYFASIKSHRMPRRGDILYSAVGATLGIPAIVDTDESFCFQRHVALIRPNPKMITSKFLWYMLRSKSIFNKAWSETTGSAQPTVPLRAIRALQIPVPSIEEQHKIIVHLDGLQSQLDALKRHQAETAAALDSLLPAVLERAFRGEL
jgi:type I restriction enzyme S subunit